MERNSALWRTRRVLSAKRISNSVPHKRRKYPLKRTLLFTFSGVLPSFLVTKPTPKSVKPSLVCRSAAISCGRSLFYCPTVQKAQKQIFSQILTYKFYAAHSFSKKRFTNRRTYVIMILERKKAERSEPWIL